MAIPLANRLNLQPDQWTNALAQFACDLRVAVPATVQSFDQNAQTLVVEIALAESMIPGLDGVPTTVPIGVISDVPIALPRAGGFALTMPLSQGDEVLLVFSDLCIDGWFQSGAANGPQKQIAKRRHSVSDAVAICGVWNQQRLLSNYSTAAAQLRSDDGTTVVEVGKNEVTIKATTVTVQSTNATVNASSKATIAAPEVDITGSTKVVIAGSGNTTIEGGSYLNHTHSGVQAGGGVSGPVTPGT